MVHRDRDVTETGARGRRGWPGRSLLLKHAVFVTLVFVSTTALLGHLAYRFARRMLVDDAQQRLSLVASARASSFEKSAGERVQDVALIAAHPGLVQLLERRAAGQVDEPTFRDDAQRQLTSAKQVLIGAREISIATTEGRVIATTKASLLETSIASEPAFNEGLQQAYLGRPRRLDGQYVADVATLVNSARGSPLALLLVEADVTSLARALTDRSGLGRTGRLEVATRAGEQFEYLLPSAGDFRRSASAALDPPMDDACMGHTGVRIARVGGREVLAAYRPVSYGPPGTQRWGLAAMIDLDEAYAPVMRLRRLLIALQVGFVLAGIGASCWLARRLTRPIVELTAAAATIAGGNLDARVPVTSSDEIGQLAAWFNRMCEHLAESRSRLEKRVEERTQEIRSREEINRAILATAHEAFVAIDQESVIRKWNERARATFGWTAEEAIGRKLTETIIPPRFVEAHRQGVERFLAGGQGPLLNRRIELVALHRDGHEFPVEITIAPVRQGEGFLFSAFVHDVTEQRAAQRELERAKVTAEAASRAKSAFLANMSHEIRTPMNAIIGMTELVLDTQLTPTQREYLAMVQESAESLLSVINDILDFSKIEAGHFELDESVFEIRDLLGDTMKSLALRAHRKGLELACHVDPTIPEFVVGDKYRLRQIVVNLVGNALKFTDEGEVVLDAACEPGGAAAETGRLVVHFTVRDTGIGIPADKQKLIFEAFEQADETVSRRFGGTGLGLAISSRLVELMGGQIWVASQIGKGSEFHFTGRFGLPADGAQLPQPAGEASLRGVRVLVVDDNRTNGLILEEMLRDWEMQPVVVSRSTEALGVMREQKRLGRAFDLALVDLNMPGINGFELIEQMRRDEPLCDTIAILLTSSGRSGNGAQRERLQIAACLTKPVKQSELWNAICESLGAKTIARPAAAVRPVAATRPRRILLAEDSPVNQKLALALLEPRGHTVVVANNGAEAVAKWSHDDFDLILMDVQMPDMDGLEATQIIRERERGTGRHTPILAMTAHAIKGDRELCLASGMDAYVAKPVRAGELFATIERLLEGPQPAAAPPDTRAESLLEVDSADDVLDWAAALARADLNETSARELAALFVDECPKLLGLARAALAEHDAAKLRRAAHTLKGSAAVFHAARTTAAAADLEALARSGDLAAAAAACDKLRAEAQRLLAALEEHLTPVSH